MAKKVGALLPYVATITLIVSVVMGTKDGWNDSTANMVQLSAILYSLCGLFTIGKSKKFAAFCTILGIILLIWAQAIKYINGLL